LDGLRKTGHVLDSIAFIEANWSNAGPLVLVLKHSFRACNLGDYTSLKPKHYILRLATGT